MLCKFQVLKKHLVSIIRLTKKRGSELRHASTKTYSAMTGRKNERNTKSVAVPGGSREIPSTSTPWNSSFQVSGRTGLSVLTSPNELSSCLLGSLAWHKK